MKKDKKQKLLKQLNRYLKPDIEPPFTYTCEFGLTIHNYFMSLLKGKCGWKYLSISKIGSVFTDDTGMCIVPVSLHKTIPVLSKNGKYTSPEAHLVKCIRLNKTCMDFEGIVFTNKGAAYLGSTIDCITQGVGAHFIPPQPVSLMTSAPETLFSEVTAEEVDIASTIYMQALHKAMEDTNEKFNNLTKYYKSTDVESLDPETKKELDSIEEQFKNIDESNLAGMKEKLDIVKNFSTTLKQELESSKEEFDKLQEITDIVDENKELDAE